MSKKDLASRWGASRENQLAGESIFNVLKHGGVLTIDQSPFGRQGNDRIDFRGYDASRSPIKNVTAKDADFSYSDFSSAWLERNQFDNCLFDSTDFSDASDHGNRFDHCSFLRSNFQLAALGYKGSVYRDCLFKDCKFQRTIFIRAEFVNTDFVHRRLKGIDFNASSFENCKFEGVLEDLWFRGTFPLESDFKEFGQPKKNMMENVSFEKADLRDLTFSDHCDLSTVRLTGNGRYFKYGDWHQRLLFLSKEIASWADERQRNEAKKFVKVSLVHAAKQDWEILSLDDLEEFYGGRESARQIVDTLNRF